MTCKKNTDADRIRTCVSEENSLATSHLCPLGHSVDAPEYYIVIKHRLSDDVEEC